MYVRHQVSCVCVYVCVCVPKLSNQIYNHQFAITGYESQVITLALQTGEGVKAEPGTMMFMTGGMRPVVTYEGCCGRCCSGEACYVVNYVNNGSKKKSYVALTPNFPTSKVVPINMSNVGGALITQQGAYMASSGDVSVGVSFDCNFVRCCCGGLGLVRQKLTGTGTAFLAATGTIVTKTLQAGETILVDTNCVLAFSETCKLDLRRAGGILGMLGGGEGIFNTTLTGPGLVVVQSMNQQIFLQALTANKIVRR